MIRALADALLPAVLILVVFGTLTAGNVPAAVVFTLAFLWVALHSAADRARPDEDA